MKTITTAWLLLVCVATPTTADGNAQVNSIQRKRRQTSTSGLMEGHDKLLPFDTKTNHIDDIAFWNKIIQESVSSSYATPSPTQEPSDMPSDIPTSLPSDTPSGIPTQAPSESPSAAPTDICIVETQLTCTGPNGEDCADIKPPQGSCTLNGPPKTLRFRITDYTSCQDSINSQQGFLDSCLDQASVQPTLQNVDVSCTSPFDPDWDYFVAGISIGDTISLNANRGDVGLPTQITCRIFPAGSTSPDQIVAIELTQDQDLFLQDTFGSLILDACNEMDCFQELTYEYTIFNTGGTNATVTAFTRERQESQGLNMLNLLPDLSPIVITPDTSSQVRETELANYCLDNVYFTTVAVIAEPPTGLTCPAETTYQFETNVGCRVDVDIACVTQSGLDCQDIRSPEGSCGLDGPIDVLRFTYLPSTCDDSAPSHTQIDAFCQDLSTLPDGPVCMDCTADPDGEILVVEGGKSVSAGESILITSPDGGPLPPIVYCSISDGAVDGSTVYQEFTFATTNGDANTAELKVKDKFGSLQLEACTDTTGSGVDCLQVVTYTYNIVNVGVNDMSLTDLERTRNNDTESLVDLLDVTNLKPGESTQVVEGAVVDICEADVFATQVSVNADPQNGLVCFDEDVYSFEITPPCDISVEMTCTTIEDGLDCASALQGEQLVECRCLDDCATELVYRFTGGGCDGTNANECTDSESNDETANIVFQSDGVTYFIGDVSVGEDIVVAGAGECLPEDFEVTVSTTDGEVSQVVLIDASCAAGSVTLLDTFGAFEFSGYTCLDQIPHRCYVDVEFEVVTTGTGTVGQDISDWELVLNGATFTPEENLPTLGPQESYVYGQVMEIELCADGQYSAETSVMGIGYADGQPCTDSDSYSFDIVVGTPFPSPSPSETPTAAPSGSPSLTPSGSPSSSPSAVPSGSPSTYPSTVPSSSPSNGPSATPSSSPSDLPSDVPSSGPSVEPSDSPSSLPSDSPSIVPTFSPSANPSSCPSVSPSGTPSDFPSDLPSLNPSASPSFSPSSTPSSSPSLSPSDSPSDVPSSIPSADPSSYPSAVPSDSPSSVPTFSPSANPSSRPSVSPSTTPSDAPSDVPSTAPSDSPSDVPSSVPSAEPSDTPSAIPSDSPSSVPTVAPSATPSTCPSMSPSAAPSDSPSDVPSSVPSAEPSDSPSAVPSDSPSVVPTFTPSANPSSCPSNSPSAVPSDSPSDFPSSVPSTAPSVSPSTTPSSTPSSAPSSNPSSVPSTSPTQMPSAPPSEEFCEMDLELTCIPPPGSNSCNITPPAVERCEGRAYEMGMLYTGGDCSQSFNVQAAEDLFFCTDLNGGPPTERGELSYIVVTDLDQEIIYHSDWVPVGEVYTLYDGGERFEANQLITIYSSNETSEPGNVLQSVQYHSSCSSNLFLKDRFGASQLILWVNEVQGTVSCFANQTFELDITIPVDIQGGPATLTSLTIASNIDPFFFNLTDKVGGVVVGAAETVGASISVPVDLTSRKTYNLLVTVTAETALGQICRASELTSFEAGYPLPPIFPTFAPTQSPTGTNPPTPDPESSKCTLDADISCSSASGTSCRRLEAPTDTVCNSQGSATSVSFLYTGAPCGSTPECLELNAGVAIADEQVFVRIEGRDGAVGARQLVSVGDIITVTSGLARDITITILTADAVVGTASGIELQSISRIRTECNGRVDQDLTLLKNYGAMQLTGFSSPNQGQQNIYEQLTFTYSVTNEGPLDATLNSAVKTQPGLVELLRNGEPRLIPGFQSISFVDGPVTIDLSAGGQFRYDFFVAGEGPGGEECFDDENYVFSF